MFRLIVLFRAGLHHTPWELFLTAWSKPSTYKFISGEIATVLGYCRSSDNGFRTSWNILLAWYNSRSSRLIFPAIISHVIIDDKTTDYTDEST